MTAKQTTDKKAPAPRQTAAEKAADHEKTANDALDGGDKDRKAAGAVDPIGDPREHRPEDGPIGPRIHDQPDDAASLGKDQRDEVTPNRVIDDPSGVVFPSQQPQPSSPDANHLGVDINAAPDGSDRVPPVTVDGKPLPVDERGVPIGDHGTIEPSAETGKGKGRNRHADLIARIDERLEVVRPAEHLSNNLLVEARRALAGG